MENPRNGFKRALKAGKAQIGLGQAGEGEASLTEGRKIWRGSFDSITVEAI